MVRRFSDPKGMEFLVKWMTCLFPQQKGAGLPTYAPCASMLEVSRGEPAPPWHSYSKFVHTSRQSGWVSRDKTPPFFLATEPRTLLGEVENRDKTCVFNIAKLREWHDDSEVRASPLSLT